MQVVTSTFRGVAEAGKRRLTSCGHCDTINIDWLFISMLESALKILAGTNDEALRLSPVIKGI